MVFNFIKKIFLREWSGEELRSAEEARKKIPWMHPWDHFEDLEGGTVKELRREITTQHVLYRKRLIPIGHSSASDDVLFKIIPGEEYAIVHLTFHKETSSIWPGTTIYKNLNACIDALKSESARRKEITMERAGKNEKEINLL